MVHENARFLTEAERMLIARLLKLTAEPRKFLDQLEGISVVTMEDGGMGGFRFVRNGGDEQSRIMGSCMSQLEFHDSDGVKAIAYLDVDQKGDLFELDIWKTDFTPLIRLPT